MARLRSVLFLLGGAALLLASAVLILSEVRLERRFNVPVQRLELDADNIDIGRGRHLAVAIAQCAHCHGGDFGGRELVDDLPLGRLFAPNLTDGEGGIGSEYSDADFTRAIRHGVGRDGRALLLMPAQYFRSLDDADVAALIGYLRTLPAVDRTTPAKRIGPMMRAVLIAGRAPDLLPAELIDHDAEPPPAPPARVGRQYGEHLVNLGGWRVCHHDDLKGGLHPLAVPDEPEPPDITVTGRLAHWSFPGFVRALRFGITPEGDRLDSRYMPWPQLGQMSDEELAAIWAYLRTLPMVGPRTPRG